MSDAILHFATELMSSWWIYLALWGFAALDGFFPAIPSETPRRHADRRTRPAPPPEAAHTSTSG